MNPEIDMSANVVNRRRELSYDPTINRRNGMLDGEENESDSVRVESLWT
jgi:hypothetical protein